MKLLIILNDLDIGGAQNYTISLMNEFVRLKHEVDLRILSENLLLEDRLDKRIHLKIWPRKKKTDLLVLRKIRNEVIHGEYDGIISSYFIYLFLSTIFLKKSPTTIYPIHSTVDRNRKSYWINYLSYRLKRKNEVFLTSIDDQTSYLTNAYRLRKNFFTQIYNGVDTERFTITSADFDRNSFLMSMGINPVNKIILMVAGFREEKRHIDALNAFKQLKQERNDVSLVFVGDNRKAACDELRSYSEKIHLKDVHFFTADIAGDVRNYYWSSHIFTLTSNKVETFPISALEAMSSGLPCVITDTGGARNFIKQNRNGVIVEPENPISICEGWKTCLKVITDGVQRQIRMDIIEKYSLKNSATLYLQLIDGYKC